MGYNTVVLVLNDFMHEVMKSPHTFTWAVCHPPLSDSELYIKSHWAQIELVARDHNEDVRCIRGALKVMPTYHADDKHVLVAGWNDIIRPKYEDYKYSRKKNEMIIKMPEYWLR